MSSQHDKPFFVVRNEGLRTAVPEDDFLHPRANEGIAGDSLTETQYFGICEPKAGIHGLMYMWHHPNLKVVCGGVWVWKGMKPLAQSCEIFDWRSYLSDAVLSNDLHSFTFENSYSIKVVDPLKKHVISYADAKRGNAIDLEYTAVGPPVMFADGRHFEQAMRVKGEVTLRGQHYPINSYNIRDRSWGKLRPEAHMPIPPMTWMTGVFNDNFYFNCTAFDHPELDPDWKDAFPEFSGDKTLIAGWIYRDGELTEVVSCRKKTVREPVHLTPQSIQMTLVDAKQRSYTLDGRILAASIMPTWSNMRSAICLTRWEYDGQVAHGDSQEVQMHDFIYAMQQRG